jgi:glycerol-3-phosphate acyltransferase PlsX
MASRHRKKLDFSIINADQTISCDEAPMEAVRSKPGSSIVVGIKLVRDGGANAFVSAGNTGAVLCAALLNLGKIEGISRPAIGSILNIGASPAILIDAGANADCRPPHLVQFARLGCTYSREVLGIEAPRIGLLSNGSEEAKGNRLVKESHQLLKESGLNFIGNLEGQDILREKADVIVTDGFTGNIVLKTIEGFGETVMGSLKKLTEVAAKTPQVQGPALLRMVGLGSWGKRIDYRGYGGACLLGLEGNIIIAHGRSQATAIKNAIGLAKQTAEHDISKILKEENHAQTNRVE